MEELLDLARRSRLARRFGPFIGDLESTTCRSSISDRVAQPLYPLLPTKSVLAIEASVDRIQHFLVEGWGGRLIRGWDEEWMELPFTIGDRLGAAALGAAPGQTFIGDSTTVLLYKLARAAVDSLPERSEIVLDTDNFPTDRYVLDGVARERGLRLVWIEADTEAGVTPEQVAAAVGPRTALVVLSHVAYRSGFLADVPAITRIVHDAGALVLWDLCHSAGSVPTELDAWGVDLAVGCTYKYLNGGPGSPAFGYVARELVGRLTQPIQGWMGVRDVFTMGPEYEPAAGVRRFLSGTPPIVGMLVGIRPAAAAGRAR